MDNISLQFISPTAQRPDNGMQQLNSGFSSLSFPSNMTEEVIQKPNIAMSPMSTIGESYRNVVPQAQEESSYYPSSPMSPVFRQQNKTQLARHQSLGGEIQGIAPRNNFVASPVIHSKHTFSPIFAPISLDARSSQFSGGDNHHPLPSFLPPPPNLDTSDASQQIGRLDNTGLFLSESDKQPKSPFVTTPRTISRGNGNLLNDPGLNRDRAFSSPGPGTYLRQPSFGAKSPPAPQATSSNQILYEDKPSSWNDGPGFPASCVYNMEGHSSSPSNYDRFNSRPPRHCGTKDTQALLSPRIEMRHAASDGNFNFPPSPMLIASHMSPNPNQGRFQPHNDATVVDSSSFDSSFNGGQLHDRHSFGSMDASNSNTNFHQYQPPQSSPMQPGLVNSANVQRDNYFAHQPPAQQGVPALGLQRHNSTGSQHFLVNERGEIVGHASPVVTHNNIDSFSQAESRNNFPLTRPQRANSYGGQHSGPFNQIQPQQGTVLNFNPISFQSDGLNSNMPSSMDHHVGSVGDGRMQHHRNNTEPIPILLHQNPGGFIQPRTPASTASDSFDQALAGENIEGIGTPNEEIRDASGVGAVEETASSPSYASKLMMPSPQPIVDLTKGRISSQPLTAGASLAKSGPRMIYNVKFKRSQRNFVMGQRVTREIKIGCYVKVEADRGEDLGIVMRIIPIEKFVASNRLRSMTEDSSASGETSAPTQAANIGDMKRIMRAATHDEITLLEVKREEEDELLKICNTKVRQRGLPMSVVDAEYQYDRNKLTFFFQAEGRIDFRELVRDLFSMYKTRIWMEQIDKNGSLDEAEKNAAFE